MSEVITAEKIQKELLLNQEAELSNAVNTLIKDAAANSRAERLNKLGFIATPEVQGFAIAKNLVDSQRECERLYPGLKFISNGAMHTICEKYGLGVDGIDRYRGDVPDWAIDAIERSGVARIKWWVSTMSGTTTNSQVFDSEQEANDALAASGIPGWVYPKSNLHIAAPVKDMIGRYHPNGIPTKDPIVCIPVSGGYAVVCAWGEEGQDPMVFNAVNN